MGLLFQGLPGIPASLLFSLSPSAPRCSRGLPAPQRARLVGGDLRDGRRGQHQRDVAFRPGEVLGVRFGSASVRWVLGRSEPVGRCGRDRALGKENELHESIVKSSDAKHLATMGCGTT